MITDKKIKAIVFDYGMVLLEWDPRRIFEHAFPAGPQAVQAFLDEIQFMDWHKQQDNGRSFAEAIAERRVQFPQYAHILPDYDRYWSESVVGPIEGSVKILQRLKQAGYPLYGLSNYPAEKFRLDRPRFAFFDWFEDMVISGEVHLSKPDPAIYRLLLEKIGRPAEECLFIDDSAANIASAQKLGFTGIRFQSSAQLEQELHQLGIL
jgi:2-haloacid dehalogenase